jgi:hypothetical protein
MSNNKVQTEANRENRITFFEFSNESDKLESEFSELHLFQCSTGNGSKDSKKSNTLSSIEKPKRHSKGLTTLMGNMAIYQSYKKAFSRL